MQVFAEQETPFIALQGPNITAQTAALGDDERKNRKLCKSEVAGRIMPPLQGSHHLCIPDPGLTPGAITCRRFAAS